MERPLDGIELRPATAADLPACERVWREGLNGYLRPLGFPDVPEDNAGLRRLHAHTFSTDPSRFWVGTGADGAVVAFGSAVLRQSVWFLSMLFVDPGVQARGVGRAILDRILPSPRDGAVLSTVTDSAQPISNALYASLGIVPRMPMFNFIGRPVEGWVPPPLPLGIRAEPIESTADPAFAADRDGLDRDVIGFEHPSDHAFANNPDQRTFAYRGPDGRLAGYGAASLAGRVGPIAVRDADLLAPVLGHLLTTIQPRGASSGWLPGSAGPAVLLALEAGLRIDGFPLLVCWSAPFADFARYLPISPGLL